MRKVFRMQYEPCDGTCYAWDSRAPIEVILENDKPRLNTLVKALTKIHEPACGNINIRYGIDLDEDNYLFIGSFYHYGHLELFSNKDIIVLLETMCQYIEAFYSTDIGKMELATSPGLGHDVCEHGEDNKLQNFIVGTI
jgi:hypothetical protein